MQTFKPYASHLKMIPRKSVAMVTGQAVSSSEEKKHWYSAVTEA